MTMRYAVVRFDPPRWYRGKWYLWGVRDTKTGSEPTRSLYKTRHPAETDAYVRNEFEQRKEARRTAFRA